MTLTTVVDLMELQETLTALFRPVSLSDPYYFIYFKPLPYGALELTSVTTSSEVSETVWISLFIPIVESN